MKVNKLFQTCGKLLFGRHMGNCQWGKNQLLRYLKTFAQFICLPKASVTLQFHAAISFSIRKRIYFAFRKRGGPILCKQTHQTVSCLGAAAQEEKYSSNAESNLLCPSRSWPCDRWVCMQYWQSEDCRKSAQSLPPSLAVPFLQLAGYLMINAFAGSTWRERE